ncbi:sensor of ECF-type sigma factor [Flavobacterium sp. MFBS3-15]|uniref:sensor of ECF-type sigma factor n=1 Tax=Flavobacterium sp. MFBS3-15 TaxID=2989816 RepID=UPI00278BCBC2|nr:sensor of ECF-type sigma factor [Flavobacterium sp. MFBS3-15]
MNMKIKMLLPLLLLFSVSLFAQGDKDKKEKREQIKALKVSFLTTELKLTADESEKFWPVYNAYEEKQYKIRHDKMRQIIKKIDEVGTDKMSDKDALSYLNQLEDADEELFNLRKKLVADLKPIIGPARILKLKKAEDDFNKKLLHKYKENKKG